MSLVGKVALYSYISVAFAVGIAAIIFVGSWLSQPSAFQKAEQVRRELCNPLAREDAIKSMRNDVRALSQYMDYCIGDR